MWSSDTYLKFGDERTRPAADLLSQVPLQAPSIVYDLGCGPGNSTALLRARFSSARVIGVDNSDDMLAKATKERIDAEWVRGDLRDFAINDEPDLIFSNATYHWLDGHDVLFPTLVNSLSEGGVLAIQMPRNFDAPSHQMIRAVARRDHFRVKLEPLLRQDPVSGPEVYYELLCDLSDHLLIWETEYLQPLEGDAPVLNWVKGTALRPLLNALNDEEKEAYLSELGSELALAYPKSRDGKTLFPFKRIFIVAQV